MRLISEDVEIEFAKWAMSHSRNPKFTYYNNEKIVMCGFCGKLVVYPGHTHDR